MFSRRGTLTLWAAAAAATTTTTTTTTTHIHMRCVPLQFTWAYAGSFTILAV